MSSAFLKYLVAFAAFFGFAAGALTGAELFGEAQRRASEFANAPVSHEVNWSIVGPMNAALVGAEAVFVLLWARGKKRNEPLQWRTALIVAPLVGYLVGLILMLRRG
ncbi:MAG: hypothetical protein U0271_03285 [Polyangiaceae bacterium]